MHGGESSETAREDWRRQEIAEQEGGQGADERQISAVGSAPFVLRWSRKPSGNACPALTSLPFECFNRVLRKHRPPQQFC